MHRTNMLTYILVTLFSWPGGIVLGNVLANLFWMPLQWLWLRFKLAAHHGAIHERLDSQDTVLAAIAGHLGIELASSGSDLHPGDDSQ